MKKEDIWVAIFTASCGDNPILYYILGLIVGAVVTTGVSMLGNYIVGNKKIPTSTKVQAGFIPPSKLEITMQDADQDREEETVLTIDKTPYLLMYDQENKPMLRPYTVKGPEIIYQK